MGSFAIAERRGAVPHLAPVFVLARLGLIAKGLVYLVIGALALLTALGFGGSIEGPRGALQAIGERPYGRVLLGVVAVGLACYVAWRWVEAVVDPERRGTRAGAVLVRLGIFVSGMVYAGLALAAARGSTGGWMGSDRHESVSLVARVLELPFGRALVVGLGAVLVGVGLHQVIRAATAGFVHEYDWREMSARSLVLARRFGVLGLSARGLVFALVGALVIIAGLEADPARVRDQGGALQLVAAQPYGAALLGAVGMGLVAYGVYCWSRARWRRFRPTS